MRIGWIDTGVNQIKEATLLLESSLNFEKKVTKTPLRFLMSVSHQCLFLRSAHEKIQKSRRREGGSFSAVFSTATVQDTVTKLPLARAFFRSSPISAALDTASDDTSAPGRQSRWTARYSCRKPNTDTFADGIFSFTGEYALIHLL